MICELLYIHSIMIFYTFFLFAMISFIMMAQKCTRDHIMFNIP